MRTQTINLFNVEQMRIALDCAERGVPFTHNGARYRILRTFEPPARSGVRTLELTAVRTKS